MQGRFDLSDVDRGPSDETFVIRTIVDSVEDITALATEVLQELGDDTRDTRIARLARWVAMHTAQVSRTQAAEIASKYGVTVWTTEGHHVGVIAAGRMPVDAARTLAACILRAADEA